MTSIQRAPEAASQLYYRVASQFPIGARLDVDPQDQVVIIQYGAVLGVLPPGSYGLHPQALPMIARAVSGPTLDAELWFVRALPMRGFRVGGALGSFVDSATGVECNVRMMAQYALAVDDPARFAVTCIGGGPTFESPDGLVGWVNSVVLRHAKELVGRAVSEGASLAKLHDVQTRLVDQLLPALQALEAPGLRVASVDDVTLMLPEDDMRNLQRAAVEAARNRMQSSLACTRCGAAHPGGRFCTQCGGALAPR
jgi:membrane protease subunit (stomatin/prohibitin family)